MSSDNCLSRLYMYYDSKLFAHGVYYADPVNTSVWAVWAEQHAQYTWFLPQTSQEYTTT